MLSSMSQTVDARRPGMIIHLGDLMSDGEALSRAYPQIPLVLVPGNCDGWTTQPLQKLIQVEGKKLLLSHGHIWQVKSRLDLAIAAARQAGADIVLFGHTHVPLCRREEDGLWVMNPGSSRTSYGMIQIMDGAVSCQLADA